jgi:predicted secreted Zn-dependent protease
MRKNRKHGYSGFTKWDLDWSFESDAVGWNTCKTIELNLDLNINVHLPDWVDYNKGTDRAKKNWNRYIKDLIEHEDIHVQISYDLAEEVYAEMIDFKAPCSKFNALFNKKANAILKKYEDKHAAFDKATYQKKKSVLEGF